MGSDPPPSGGRIQALLTLLVALFGPPVALLSFYHSLNLPPLIMIGLVLIYEILVVFVSFLTEVWQKLKQPWIETIANKIDQGTRSLLSRYYHHYCLSFTYEHRDLDVKGITTQGVHTLDLEDVFVELRVDLKAPHLALADPLQAPRDLETVPAELQKGNHTIWEYLATPRLRNQHFVVLGPPGSGKTTLLKHLGLALVHDKQPYSTKYIWRMLPVLLFLREHGKAIVDKDDYSLADAIRASVTRWNIPMPIGWIEHRLARGQCLILLDGLDEVADAKQREQMVVWVERQMRNHGMNRFLLTSRPFGYRDNPIANVTILEVQPLTFQQATKFVMSWYLATEIKSAVRDDPGVHMKAEQGAHDLLRRLRETPDLFDLVVNPLLLTMIATVHRYRGTLPGARVELYKEICEVFLGKRQAARGVVQDLRAEQRQLVLEPLAYEMMRRGVRTIDRQRAEKLIKGPLQQVSMTLTPPDFLENIQNSSGLLLEREHGIYSFAHKTFQEYLAAMQISKYGLLPILTSHVQDEWWHETIRLYCAQADAAPLIKACLNIASIQTLILALECEREALSLQASVRQQVQDVIAHGIESDDLERRKITAEALLTQRLRQMHALNEQSFIDTTLVTHAEYQLFLDEQLGQGRYYQPDHWEEVTFQSGQGQQPVLGMRRSDAQAYCAWLSERGGGIWHYRLPNEKDLLQADQDTWKNLSQETGFWTEGEQHFTWSRGQSPHFLSAYPEILIYVRALDLDLAKDIALERDPSLAQVLSIAFSRERGRVRVRGRARERAHTFNLALARASVLTLRKNRTLTKAPQTRDRDVLARARGALVRDRDALSRSYTRVNDSKIVALDNFVHAREEYCILFLLQERREQRLPAWEGILLVKERVPIG